MNKPHKRNSLVAIIILTFLMSASRVFGQAGEPLSEFFKTLGPTGVVIEFIRILGLPGMIFLIWYFDRKQMQALLDQYKKDMGKMGGLVRKTQDIGRSYAQMAEGLNDVIMLNTQAMTKIVDAIETNQFCPMVQLREVKKARGRTT